MINANLKNVDANEIRKSIHTKQLLIEDLRSSGVDPGGTLFVHSSMKAVGHCENGADTVLDALGEFMKDGLLVLPTHTWKTIDDKYNIFDPVLEPSCVGILTNLFMKRPGVIRSLHPTHSLAAIGSGAVEFVAGEELTGTPCPRNGCYGKLYDRKAQILFLGCDLSKNTFLHGVEEWNDIPRRLAKTPQQLYIKVADGIIACPQYRHFNPDVCISDNYIKMESAFIKKGVAKYCRIGSAASVLCDAAGMADLVTFCLKREPDLFGTDSALCEELYEGWGMDGSDAVKM